MRINIKILSILVLALLLVACITPKLKREELNAGERYVVSKNGQEYFSFVAPEGRWQAYPDWERRGSLRLFGSDYDIPGVGYISHFFVQNMEPFEDTKARRLYELRTQDYQGSIDTFLEDFYTPEHREELRLTNFEGGVEQVIGLTCVYTKEYQNYMKNKVMIADFICPLYIDGEIWEFGVVYRITLNSTHLKELYGAKAPSFEDVLSEHLSHLQPLYDSIEIFQNPIQTLPPDYLE